MSLHQSSALASSWSLRLQPGAVRTDSRLLPVDLCCFLARKTNHRDVGPREQDWEVWTRTLALPLGDPGQAVPSLYTVVSSFVTWQQ